MVKTLKILQIGRIKECSRRKCPAVNSKDVTATPKRTEKILFWMFMQYDFTHGS